MKNLMVQTECGSRPRWMIVDDNMDVLSLLRAVITRFIDADIQCFHSPHAALATFAASPEAFDVVITDLEMPGMSGIELAGRLRQSSPAIKVLLSTGSGILTEDEAVRKGFCGLLRKPFQLVSLRRRLEASGLLKGPEQINSKTFAALTPVSGSPA